MVDDVPLEAGRNGQALLVGAGTNPDAKVVAMEGEGRRRRPRPDRRDRQARQDS